MRQAWRRLVVILTTPITLRLLFAWWRGKPEAAEEILTLPKDEPEDGSFELEFFIPFVDTKKYPPGPLFVLERRRRAMRAQKIPGSTV